MSVDAKQTVAMKGSIFGKFQSLEKICGLMTEDRIKVNVSSTEIGIEAQGGVASRIGNQFADAISPFTNTLGILGDELRTFRIHREMKAIEALRRAKEIQDKLGIEQHPVSPKLLARWIEGASLEPDSDENITELWARLLARSPEEFSAIHVLCMDILGKLGATEARIFQSICEDQSSQDSHPSAVSDAIGTFDKSLRIPIKQSIYNIFGSPVEFSEFIKREDEIKNILRIDYSSPGSFILELDFYNATEEESYNTRPIISFNKELYKEFGEVVCLNALELLSHHGLISNYTEACEIDGVLTNAYLSVFFHGACVTSLGAKFASICIFDEQY